ncbi:hypothetical protein BHAMNSH16_10475 [Brachyspira hampsonii]|uniref:Uncharacterized protein n=1 Tax=Brachyspira hampsonii TaxID=1287055 RepID=A0AAC9XKP4_9SPIR|nr:hypothetical protein [Brachyspira hampsonii]ASJ22032.1 hypothetical protein BHAMNSH16_10475 [Brachyspira hampsonii]OEJ17723.1 hypothetical protein A9496_10205 [Brachyspira hampsonii]
MKELLYSIFHNEYFVLVISIIVLVIIFKLLMRNKYRPYFYVKDITFFILKDNINNVYIYCNRFENIDDSIHYLYTGKIFINNADLFGIYEIAGNSKKIEVFDYDSEDFITLNRKNIAEINLKNTNLSKIEYVININGKIIEGVFEIINQPQINIKNFHICGFKYLKTYSIGITVTILNHLFNFYYAFIDNKEKINFDINGEHSFSEDFKCEKEKELSDEVSSLLKQFSTYELKQYFVKIKDLYAFNILYFDEKTICIYKRITQIKENKKLIINNISLIYNLNNQQLISSYFKDLVNNTKELLKKYDAPDNFYNDDLLFLITDIGIVVMSDNEYKKIFIKLSDIKDYINKEHYLAYLFD